MSGIGKTDFSGSGIEDGAEHRGEHAAVIVRRKYIVYAGKYLVRLSKPLPLGLQQGLCHHHVQRGRHTLAGDIGNQETEIVVVDEKEIVEVAADLFGRIHGGENIELGTIRKGGEYAGSRLAWMSVATLSSLWMRSLAAVVSVRFRDVLLQVRGHPVEGVGKLLDLVAGANIQPMVEVAGADDIDPLLQQQYRRCDLSGKRDDHDSTTAACRPSASDPANEAARAFHEFRLLQDDAECPARRVGDAVEYGHQPGAVRADEAALARFSLDYPRPISSSP